jgi:6-pyruvoyl-tetrahydropterin synthase
LFEEGMIEDFGVLKEQIGEWIDAYLDHKLILSVRDPLSSLLVRETEIYLINGPPTAENLAITCAERISWLIKEPLQVYEVEFFETPNCSAIYRNPYVSVE